LAKEAARFGQRVIKVKENMKILSSFLRKNPFSEREKTHVFEQKTHLLLLVFEDNKT